VRYQEVANNPDKDGILGLDSFLGHHFGV
jgi:hypothetical protein